jgi:hypothetical protein
MPAAVGAATGTRGGDRRSGIRPITGLRGRERLAGRSEAIQRAPDTASSRLVQHVSIDHGGAHVGVAEQLLNGADVVPVGEQVGGERVAQGEAPGVPSEAGLAPGWGRTARFARRLGPSLGRRGRRYRARRAGTRCARAVSLGRAEKCPGWRVEAGRAAKSHGILRRAAPFSG